MTSIGAGKDDYPQTIGIDISKATLDCHAYPARSDRQFDNSPKGYKALIAWIGQWEIERVAYEATGVYHRAMEAALTTMPCVRLNPERARRFAQATGTLAKTDRIDAAILARMAATLQPPVRSAQSANQALLQTAPRTDRPPCRCARRRERCHHRRRRKTGTATRNHHQHRRYRHSHRQPAHRHHA